MNQFVFAALNLYCLRKVHRVWRDRRESTEIIESCLKQTKKMFQEGSKDHLLRCRVDTGTDTWWWRCSKTTRRSGQYSGDELARIILLYITEPESITHRQRIPLPASDERKREWPGKSSVCLSRDVAVKNSKKTVPFFKSRQMLYRLETCGGMLPKARKFSQRIHTMDPPQVGR